MSASGKVFSLLNQPRQPSAKISNPSQILTPLSFFGQREMLIADLFKLAGKGYETCYDPFSGSGSIAFAAMTQGVAQHYCINDSLVVLQQLWQQIQENPQQVLAAYDEYIAAATKNADATFNAVLSAFNQNAADTGNAARFAFLINYAKDNIPVFDQDGKLTVTRSEQCDFSMTTVNAFKAKVNNLHKLLVANKPKLMSGSFTECVKTAKEGDLVLCDPPYPAQSESIYYNPTSHAVMRAGLEALFTELNAKNIAFITLYGAGDLAKENQFTDERLGLQHLIRLSSHPLFGEFLEHIYVSKAIAIDAKALPGHLALYTDLFVAGTSYAEALATLQKRVTHNEEVDNASICKP